MLSHQNGNKETIRTLIFQDFSCIFEMRLLSSWFLNCFHAVLPLYVVITNKGLQAELSPNLNTSETDNRFQYGYWSTGGKQENPNKNGEPRSTECK